MHKNTAKIYKIGVYLQYLEGHCPSHNAPVEMAMLEDIQAMVTVWQGILSWNPDSMAAWMDGWREGGRERRQ